MTARTRAMEHMIAPRASPSPTCPSREVNSQKLLKDTMALRSNTRPAAKFRVRDPKTYEYLDRAVRRSCPKWLKHLENDIAQKAALKVFRLLEREGSPEYLTGSYLYKVASSVLIDEMRSSRCASDQHQESLESMELPSQDPQESPERRVTNQQIGQGILDCLSRLLRDRRMALSLKLQGYTARETAHLLGWDDKRTENLISRGRRDLRVCLRKKGLDAHV